MPSAIEYGHPLIARPDPTENTFIEVSNHDRVVVRQDVLDPVSCEELHDLVARRAEYPSVSPTYLSAGIHERDPARLKAADGRDANAVGSSPLAPVGSHGA